MTSLIPIKGADTKKYEPSVALMSNVVSALSSVMRRI